MGIKVFWIGFKQVCLKPAVYLATDNDLAFGSVIISSRAHSQF